MALFKPDAPQPPNPLVTAAAQTSTNVATGVANSFLNNVNQITPEGKLTYDVTGTHSWTDPSTGQTYNIPRFTATQEMDPYTRDYIDPLNKQTQLNLASAGQQGSFDIMNLLRDNNDPLTGAPARGNMNAFYDNPDAMTSFGDVGGQQRSLAPYGQQQTQFGEAGDITRGYGPEDNFSADRGRVEEALYGRINPQLERERGNIEQRLADQGIKYGSEAYTRAMDDYNRQANDARLAVTAAGGTEQQRMMDMAAKEAGFANAAQQQAYEQAKGRGTFANQAQLEQFQKDLQAGGFANQAQKDAFSQEALRAEFFNTGAQQRMQRDQQIFNNENQTRQQFLNEQYAQRNQQFNELTALMSGSQVQAPNFVSTPQGNIAGTDIAGLINNKFSQDFGNYQQSSNNFNQLMGGIFGMMGGMAKSDRRAKEDIDKVGSIFAAGPDGEKALPIYEFSYKDDPSSRRHTGPMAQDVEKIDRRAVREIGGVKHIDMTRMGSILKAA